MDALDPFITVAPNESHDYEHGSPKKGYKTNSTNRRSMRLKLIDQHRSVYSDDEEDDCFLDSNNISSVEDIIERLAKRVLYLDSRANHLTDVNLDKFCAKMPKVLVDEIERSDVICVNQLVNIFNKVESPRDCQKNTIKLKKK